MPLYPIKWPHFRFFGGGWEELCELCDSINSEKLGIYWDFGHANTSWIEQYAAIKEVGSRLKMTHVHDNYRRGDEHQLPGLGDAQWECIDWKKAMDALRDINYNGSLSLELVFPPLSMCETFMKLAYESLEYIKSL